MARKPRLIDFHTFESSCKKAFETYRWNYHLSCLQVYDRLPGDTRDVDIFYLLWKPRDKCTMIMMYDREETVKPYRVYVDWETGAFPRYLFPGTGRFAILSEHNKMDDAIHEMIIEPPLTRSVEYNQCTLFQYYKDPEQNYDNCGLPYLRHNYDLGCSFIEMLREIEYEKSLPDSVNKGLDIYVKHNFLGTYNPDTNSFTGYLGDTIYETTI